MAKPLVEVDDARRFLEAHHGGVVADVERLSGGYWSSAFGYAIDGTDLVVRFGADRAWFEVDRDAFAFRSDALPVPRVLDIGAASDTQFFAISERAYGVFFEDTPAGNAEPLVRSLLGGLRAAPAADVDYTWRDWLLGGLDHAGRNGPWRAAVARDEFAGPIADRAEATIYSLLDALPERRDLVHGDLVHNNVLVAPDYSKVNAVFSWKCSARGDALFDAAWLTFWGPWFPGIGAVDVWSIANDGSTDAATRFHCYQLHIGATHLCWNAQINDAEGLRRVARRLEELL
jgi:aminoglycoside phosphotransferase (APT) family kinase protein